MFTMLKLKPPHGWNAVVWELAIVTLGVIFALATQQWAEGRSWSGKVKASHAALRYELAEHYDYAVEYRTVYPCLQAQLGQLRERVLKSGQTLDPSPVYRDPEDTFVLRMPAKDYPTDAWDEAISDGVLQRYEPKFRGQLAGHYLQLGTIRTMTLENNETEAALVTLSHPLPLDAAVRYSIVNEIERMSGRLEYLDVLNGQVIDDIRKVDMLPPAERAREMTPRYGTYQFCKAHGLPMRSFNQAMQPVPN